MCETLPATQALLGLALLKSATLELASLESSPHGMDDPEPQATVGHAMGEEWMKVEIIETDLADSRHARGFVRVLDSYARDPLGGGEPLAEDVKQRLVGGLREHPTTVVFLAVAEQPTSVEEEVVGVATCFRGYSTFAAQPLLNIHDIAILPDWRGQGIGRQLLEGVESYAKSVGCCRLTLEVLDSNSRAEGLYRSFGFCDYLLGDEASLTRFLKKEL